MSDSFQQALAERNRQTSGNWASFESHRTRVRQLLEQHVRPDARSICVLGAGNANDLDLPWLAERFQRVTLVDLDDSAMRAGVLRQLGRNVPTGLTTVRLDVTGVFDRFNAVFSSATGPSSADLRGIRETLAARPVAVHFDAQFDCVVSTCLLSQLIDAVKSATGEQHPEFVPLVLAMRAEHLALAAQLTAKQGLIAIILDFVSSLTCPQLGEVDEDRLPAFAREQIARHNFFTGLNPQLVQRSLESELSAVGRSSPVVLTAPWRWDLGPRIYLVAALLAALP